jgi:rRNA maturation endonuclease Nob1
MARFRCRACGQEGTFVYTGGHACPKCGSPDVQFALSIDELADDDPLIVALTKMADDSTEQT